MIHHAARLNAALPSSFQSILRDAASRAFTRTQLPAASTRGVATQLAQASTSATRVDVEGNSMLARYVPRINGCGWQLILCLGVARGLRGKLERIQGCLAGQWISQRRSDVQRGRTWTWRLHSAFFVFKIF